ncbi:MAG: cyclic nucleotide-binding domain-containing protein [Nitrospira sp.]|nr:cyclic nucleotide-binding domain-containing protein [Nitrospira sp.]
MNKLWENIFKTRQKKKDDINDILIKIPVFNDLNSRALTKIKRILHQREYKANEVIFNQGDVGLGMYIIESGSVEIVCNPERHILAQLHEGDFFGELALLDESPRSASAIAKTPCRMLCFFKPELLDLLDRDPKLGSKILFKLAWTIGERLKTTNQQVKELSCSTYSTKPIQ